MSRRALLGALALVGLPAPVGAQGQTLAARARSVGLRFGSAVRRASLGQPEIAALLARECAVLTPELELKWAAFAPEAGRVDTGDADAIADFARGHGLRLRGHTLLWHRSVPPWLRLEGNWDAVGTHIAQVVGRYGALVDEWDVVNEPIADGGLRASPFLAAFGPDYIARALHAAAAAAPGARLFINEFDLEYDVPEQAARRAALLALATRLIRAGAPLHGIGIQAHLAVGRAPFAPAVLADFLKAVAGLGLAISITELDVKERDYVRSVVDRDAIVADHAARFLAVALAQPAVRSLSCWGLSDRQTWLDVTAADRARFPTAWQDGSSPGLNRGLPYDAACVAKPFHDVLAQAIGTRR